MAMANSLPDNQSLLPRQQRRQVDAPAARDLISEFVAGH